jgi:hypothetical protein
MNKPLALRGFGVTRGHFGLIFIRGARHMYTASQGIYVGSLAMQIATLAAR